MKKILITLFVLPLIAGCSTPGSVSSTKSPQVNININQQNPFSREGYIIAEVSKTKGADFTARINLNSYGIKANVSGVPAKLPSDAALVDVYLLTLPAGFSGTDPLGTANANVVKMFANQPKTGNSFNLLFKNVPGMTNNQYWVGIVTKDSGGNVIAKANVAWTGQTAAFTPALSLSTSGIGVDPVSLAVSSTNDLTVNISLLDAVGASINTNANVTAGTSNLPPLTAQ